jgi:hypothetical protein
MYFDEFKFKTNFTKEIEIEKRKKSEEENQEGTKQ